MNTYRNFGLLFGALIPGVLGILLPILQERSVPLEPFIVGLGFLAFALLVPHYLKPVYEAWMQLGDYLGWFNTRVLLGIIFYGVIFPTGLLKRLWSDPLSRQFESKIKTYRVNSTIQPPKQMEHPY